MNEIIPQKDLFPNLIKLKKCDRAIEYPIGSYMRSLLDYSVNAADELAKLFPKDNIALIVRGTSGVMIGGLIASYLIHNTGIHSKVIINRKPEEVCHADNLEGLNSVLNYDRYYPFRLVIADDFICSGQTICNIVNDVESYISQPFIFDALIIHNKLIYDGYLNEPGVQGDLILRHECITAKEVLLTKFLNILCL